MKANWSSIATVSIVAASFPGTVIAQDVNVSPWTEVIRSVNPLTDTIAQFSLALEADSGSARSIAKILFACDDSTVESGRTPRTFRVYADFSVNADSESESYSGVVGVDPDSVQHHQPWFSAIVRFPPAPARKIGPLRMVHGWQLSRVTMWQVLPELLKNPSSYITMYVQLRVLHMGLSTGAAYPLHEIFRWRISPEQKEWIRRWVAECGLTAPRVGR